MTRLFIQFYFGVLLILFAAWWVQAYVSRTRLEADNVLVAESALGGGVRIGRDDYIYIRDINRDPVGALYHVKERFDYPVELLSSDDLPDYANSRFQDGDDIFLIGRKVEGENRGFMLAKIDGGRQALQFGPLPEFAKPKQTEMIGGLGLIMFLAAVAIAFLLRPITRQFRQIEQTASAIASGDFSARVDERKAKSAGTLAKAFNNMAGQTETLLRTQRELLQAVSHELRTPLSRLHFGIDLIRQADDQALREERLDKLESATQELDDLVGELIRYVRLETSEPELEIADVALAPLIEDIFEGQFVLHPNVDLQLDDEVTKSDIGIHADQSSLRRALGNLTINACRFAKSKVVVSAERTDGAVIVHVDDDGRGIPEADRKRVFDPFVRLDDSKRGVGLGLALVRRIILHHGGSIEVHTSPLGGCRMRTVWPVTSDD